MIISLTTIPQRINNIKETLNSLINQNVKAEKIILNLPEYCKLHKSKYIIPDFVKEMVNKDEIEINYCDRDYGPATKLYPLSIKYNSLGLDKNIIVVDDDCIYDPNLVKSYLVYLKKEKYKNCALTLRGGPKDKNEQWFKLHLHNKRNDEVNCFDGIEVDIMTGVTSFMIQSKFIDKDYLSFEKSKDKQLRKLAYKMDDDWLSGYLSKKNITKYLIPAFKPTYLHKYGYYKINSKQLDTPAIKGGNKTRRKYVISHFDCWKFLHF